jgi:hypothetical protein
MNHITSTVLTFNFQGNVDLVSDITSPKTTKDLSTILERQPESTSNRLVVLEYPSSAPLLLPPRQNQQASVPNTTCSELSHVLQSSLKAPHTLLHIHRISGNNHFRFTSHFDTPALPTESGLLSENGGTISLPYYELRRYQPKIWNLQQFVKDFRDPLTEEFELTCSTTGRQLQIHESADATEGPLIVVPRRVTYWRNVESSGRWDGKHKRYVQGFLTRRSYHHHRPAAGKCLSRAFVLICEESAAQLPCLWRIP